MRGAALQARRGDSRLVDRNLRQMKARDSVALGGANEAPTEELPRGCSIANKTSITEGLAYADSSRIASGRGGAPEALWRH
jgi:hypothetical protein